MKSQKGVTMMSLVVYVASFLAVTGVIATITTFFYNNIGTVNTNIGSNAYYNKLNLFLVNETKKRNNRIINWGDDYIYFNDGYETNRFIYLEGMVYFNKVAICKSVSEFKIIRETSDNGEDSFKVFITIDGISYTTKYTI